MTRSPESLRETGIMGPSMERALKVRPFPQMPQDYIEHRKARAAHLSTLRHLMPVPGPIDQVAEREIFVTARDGYQIRVIHYTPRSQPVSKPAMVVLYHEGGWGMGDLTDEEFNARHLVRDLGVVCLNVEYRLAPENPFPTGIHDAWDVLEWSATNAASLGADPTQGLIVGGSSAGANMAAVLAHLSRSGGLDAPVTGQWLSVPYLIPSMYVPEKYQAEYLSMRENVIDPVIGEISLEAEQVMMGYLKIDPLSALFSVVASEYYPPTDESSKAKGALAKAFIQVAGLDPLRDHGLVYDQILQYEYGTDTSVKIYPGVGHMFWTNWPELDASKTFATDMIEGFRWLLTQPEHD